MKTEELSENERLELAEFFLSVYKTIKSGGQVDVDTVRGMCERISRLIKSNAFTFEEKDELADMYIKLSQSIKED